MNALKHFDSQSFFALALLLAFFSCQQTFGQEGVGTEKNFYVPLQRKIEGWTIHYDPQLDLPEHSEVAEKTFKALANHLQRVTYIVQPKQLEQLRQCKIWIDRQHPTLTGMQYHPERGWLIENGCDPRLEKHVHIPVAEQLSAKATWVKHPYVVLHELAHAYHDNFLGFDNSEIEATFEAAKAAGIYDSVLDHRGETVKHYALNNAKEYFAEMTEAYLGVNDFYPFVRGELQKHDPRMYRRLQNIWGKID